MELANDSLSPQWTLCLVATPVTSQASPAAAPALLIAAQVFVTIPKVEKEDLVWGWSNPLRPFSYDLWAAIFGSLLLAAIAYVAAGVLTVDL